MGRELRFRARRWVPVLLVASACAFSCTADDGTANEQGGGSGVGALGGNAALSGSGGALAGSTATGGASGGAGTAGSSAVAGTSAVAGSGGVAGGGMTTGGSGGVAGSTPPPAGSGGMGTAGSGEPPPPGDWGTADPAMKGSFATTTEENVGPGGGFTLFRPADLTTSGKRHPLITWGNGTGTTPPVYGFLLNHLASHGFVIIASNDENVAQGDPPLMVQGVIWVGEQNDDPSSSLYQHIDMDHVGATGHSQGAFAASTAAADPSVLVWAPIQGATAVRGQHGPGLLFCGGMDTTVPCSGAQRTFDAIDDLPLMYAELKAASHTNWFGGFGMVHPYVVMTTAWMRVHLMGDTGLRDMFYGPSCTLCSDDAWVVMQKNLD